MIIINSADAIKNWNEVSKSVINGKPIFFREDSNHMMLSSFGSMESLLSGCRFSVKKFIENDGRITLSLNEIEC